MQPFLSGQFAGNECSKLLQNVDILQRIAKKSCTYQVQGFIETFRSFRNFVNSYFGQIFDDSFLEKLNTSSNYTSTCQSLCLLKHRPFFSMYQNSSNAMIFDLFSESATEAVHSNFTDHWKSTIELHPEYGSKFFQCIVNYNSKYLSSH